MDISMDDLFNNDFVRMENNDSQLDTENVDFKNHFETLLNQQQQNVNIIKSELKEKISLRNKLLDEYAKDNKIISDITLELVNPIEVLSSWQKFTNNSWIIGFDIRNLSATTIRNFTFLFSMTDYKIKSTAVVKITDSHQIMESELFQSSGMEILPMSYASVVAIFNEPTSCLNMQIKLNGRFVYSFQDDKNNVLQLKLPEVELTGTDYFNGKHELTFDGKNADLIACLVTWEKLHLSGISPVDNSTDFKKVLTRLKFKSINHGNFMLYNYTRWTALITFEILIDNDAESDSCRFRMLVYTKDLVTQNVIKNHVLANCESVIFH